MSIGGIAISFLIAAAFLVWLLQPFLWPEDSHAPDRTPTARQRERLHVYYQRVLRNVHDLDEDFGTGKLNEAEYRQEREMWVKRGIQALKALDALDSTHLVAPARADDAEIDDAIEVYIDERIEEVQPPS